MIGRRGFCVGAALAAGCSKRPTPKAVAVPPHRFVYESPGTITTFVPGPDVHHVLESIWSDRGNLGRIVAITRGTGAAKVVVDGADTYPTLAVSSTNVWFRKDGLLASVPRAGGPVKTFFRLPSDLYGITADAGGVYAIRAKMSGELALHTDSDLVAVDDAGALRVLATGLFPHAETPITTSTADVLLVNTTGSVTGPCAVAKTGGSLRRSPRRFDQERGPYRLDDRGLHAIDPATGAVTRTLIPTPRAQLIGALPGGAVLVRSESKTHGLGSNAQSFSYAVEYLEGTSEDPAPAFPMRAGQLRGAGMAGSVVAWAADKEVGEIG